jgi:hypothetical protein
VGRRCAVRQPALDAFTLLAALAGRTEPVLLGTACMGSFALRDPRVFAYEWASLDVLSHGRTRLSVCSGGGGGAWDAETAAMDIPPAERRRRMIENVHVLRHLWTRDNEPFEGRFIRFSGITLEPKPVQAPCPIWLTTNAARLSSGQSGTGGSALALERVGRVADGWMTHSVSPAGFRRHGLSFLPPPRMPAAPSRASTTCCAITSISTRTVTRRWPMPSSSSICTTPPTTRGNDWRHGWRMARRAMLSRSFSAMQAADATASRCGSRPWAMRWRSCVA